MKYIIIVEVDGEALSNSYANSQMAVSEIPEEETLSNLPDIEDMMSQEFGWIAPSGIIVSEIISTENLDPNDQTLGNKIRQLL